MIPERAPRVDVHQHLWPPEFLDALRSRRHPPRLDGWTLLLDGEPAYEIDPRAHDPVRRADQAVADDLDSVLVASAASLGIADLPPDEAAELALAWHEGALALPEPFRPWATAGVVDPDPAALRDALLAGCVGLELPADALATPAAVERLGDLLSTLELAGAPLLVHPGPARPGPPSGAPAWWAPVVGYVQQLHAAWWAWWAWREVGASSFPALRICFCALAGLAPLHDERHRSRGGDDRPVDPRLFLEISSYGPRAVDATIRALGVDVLCLGSDRPYAAPPALSMGEQVDHALRVTNPARLLTVAVGSGRS